MVCFKRAEFWHRTGDKRRAAGLRHHHGFNPLLLPKQGETCFHDNRRLDSWCFNPLLLPKQGETSESRRNGRTAESFNPLLLPKQGET